MDVEVVIKRMATMGAELDLLLAAPLDADYRRAAVGGPGVGSVDAPTGWMGHRLIAGWPAPRRGAGRHQRG